MARRIKEEPIIHQNRIAEKAMYLFAEKGIENTKMSEIATAAGYGKATLYVYFKNKEDIVSFIAFQSMEKLKTTLFGSVKVGTDTKDIFFSICSALVKFQEEYPSFFERSLQYIQVERNSDDNWLSKAYDIGEEINHILIEYLEMGVESGELAETDNFFETIMLMWGMISGVIRLAANKEEYFRIGGGVSKEKFLRTGFEKIYKTLIR